MLLSNILFGYHLNNATIIIDAVLVIVDFNLPHFDCPVLTSNWSLLLRKTCWLWLLSWLLIRTVESSRTEQLDTVIWLSTALHCFCSHWIPLDPILCWEISSCPYEDNVNGSSKSSEQWYCTDFTERSDWVSILAHPKVFCKIPCCPHWGFWGALQIQHLLNRRRASYLTSPFKPRNLYFM